MQLSNIELKYTLNIIGNTADQAIENLYKFKQYIETEMPNFIKSLNGKYNEITNMWFADWSHDINYFLFDANITISYEIEDTIENIKSLYHFAEDLYYRFLFEMINSIDISVMDDKEYRHFENDKKSRLKYF